MRIEPTKFREEIVASAAVVMMERSKRYTADRTPKHIPLAYMSMAQHLVDVAESTAAQLAAKTPRGAHTPLTWLCIILGPTFEQDIARLQRKLAPGREL